MKRVIIAAAAAAALAGSFAAQAADDDNPRGFYLGGGVGQFNINIDGIDGIDEAVERLDDSDTSWQAFVGWRFNRYVALQAAYIDFGRPEDSFSTSGSSGDYQAHLSGFAPSLIGYLPLGPVELSASVGYYFYNVDITADLDDLGGNVFKSSDSGEDLMYGVGLGLTFFERLNAKLEYQKIDLKGVEDADALWFTGQWRF